MSHSISSLWLSPPKDLASKVRGCIDSARDKREKRACKVFFRADDVAVPGSAFTRLMELFLGIETGLDMVFIGSAFILGGLITMAFSGGAM